MARDASESEGDSLPVNSTPTTPIAPANGPHMPTNSQQVYEVRPRKDKRGVDLISEALPYGRLWYGEPNAVSSAIGYAQHYSRPCHRPKRYGRFRSGPARALHK